MGTELVISKSLRKWLIWRYFEPYSPYYRLKYGKDYMKPLLAALKKWRSEKP